MASILDIPPDLEHVQSCIFRFLTRVQDRLESQLASDLPPVQQLTRHVERYRGKMIRPTLVALCGLAVEPKARGGDISTFELSDAHVTIAAVCEMVHLATLVHDDVLDEADARRRTRTVNSLHGNETAVILGDYLFSAAFALCATLERQEASLAIAQVGMTLCAGELVQLHHRDDFSLDEATYFEIIDKKTASLISTACRFGAKFSNTDSPTVARLQTFGTKLGIAFQIQDDLLDLTGDELTVGKSVGKDVEKGKMTLPLIHHLVTSTPAQRGATLAMLADSSRSGVVRARELVSSLNSTQSVAHAQQVAERLVAEARSALGQLPDSPAKAMLSLMADSVVSRSF